MTRDTLTVIRVPEAVGVFASVEALQGAIYDLMMVGFSRHDISLLADHETVEKTLGRHFWSADELEDDPAVPRTYFVSEEAMGELEGSVAGGFFFLGSYIAMLALLTPASTLAASVAAIAIGGGPAALVGTLAARQLHQHHVEYYADQLRRGGILLWVRVKDAEREALARDILRQHSGKDVHVHDWST
ncbi:hypothetical protein [Sagittula salina]|uniref:Uncharacterized protein n=1 Tax=Sagittula salina TaxID=2820268 RepID=A0A940MSH9_9RHOB|nr:hypothetical protein [Sagittula salina]MBP0482189.1 hypothetical protein [Sagittula salina]